MNRQVNGQDWNSRILGPPNKGVIKEPVEFLTKEEIEVISKSTQEQIDIVVTNIGALLKYKNTKYGDSALKPIKIFSKMEAQESICQRLDDKIARIMNSQELRKNDISDTIGYLVLLCINNNWTTFDEFMD